MRARARALACVTRGRLLASRAGVVCFVVLGRTWILLILCLSCLGIIYVVAFLNAFRSSETTRAL